MSQSQFPVWFIGQVASSAVVVYLAIQTYVQSGDECPPQETLAAYAGVSVRTVKRAIVALRSLGVIRVENRCSGGKRTSNRYSIVAVQNQGPQVAHPKKRKKALVPRKQSILNESIALTGDRKRSLHRRAVSAMAGERRLGRNPFREAREVDEVIEHFKSRVELASGREVNCAKRLKGWRKTAVILLRHDGRTVDEVLDAIDIVFAGKLMARDFGNRITSLCQLREDFDGYVSMAA